MANRFFQAAGMLMLVLACSAAFSLPAQAQTYSGPPYDIDGDWKIWCERTVNHAGNEASVHNDGAQVLGYMALKGDQYPKTGNRCYVQNVSAQGRSLRLVEIYPTGEHDRSKLDDPSCNKTFLDVLGSDVRTPGIGGHTSPGDIASFSIRVLRYADCGGERTWSSSGTISGYLRLKEQFGTTEFLIPVTYIIRP